MPDRRRRRSPNHPALRPIPVQDATGEMSWPLVERRRAVRTDDPVGQIDQLARANELLLALQKMAVTLSSSLDVDEVIQRGVEQARRVVKADTIIVALYDRSDDRWSLVAGPDSVIDVAVLPADSPVARCVDSDRPLVLTGGQLWSEADHGVYQVLRARGDVLGFLAGEWSGGHEPAIAEREAIVGVADALALALDNARIFSRLADRVAHDERSRVARELHDRVSGSLAAIGYELDDVARGLGEVERAAITRVRAHLGETVTDLRDLLDDLRTDRDGHSIDRGSIATLIERTTRRSGIAVTLRHDLDPSSATFDVLRTDGSATELHLMIREALLNAERHSGAGNILVELEEKEGSVVIRVSDDGRGFDHTKVGHGLSGMRERADWIGASLDVAPDTRGTVVTITLPVELQSAT